LVVPPLPIFENSRVVGYNRIHHDQYDEAAANCPSWR
jgi:hypothetical protein